MAKTYTCLSPAGKLQLAVNAEDGNFTIGLTDLTDNTVLLAPSPIGIDIERNGKPLTIKAKKAKSRRIDAQVNSPFYRKAKVIDKCNTIRIDCTDGVALEARAYDNGIAYRWIDTKGGGRVVNERFCPAFADNPTVWSAYTPSRNKKTEHPTLEEQLWTDMQGRYLHLPINELDTTRLIYTPLLVEMPGGRKLATGETDVLSYPGMYMMAVNGGFKSMLAHMPSKVVQGGHNDLENLVVERHTWLAEYDAPRSMPWRVVMVSRSDAELANNDLLYVLSPECRLDDISWIKPGKVAWDWWCDWNLRGVDFEAGINTATYKKIIDFAAENNIEYVILDEGWATKGKCDLFDVIPEINLTEIVGYATDKGIGIILWAGYLAMENNLEQVVSHYSNMGVKGFKVDFLDRDDAEMMDFMERCADVCARHRMMVDFHGCTKPTGLHRAYPNIVNYEAVFGLEQLKWTKGQPDMPAHDLTLPFTRLLAGPMDYTQGAMRNFVKNEYSPNRKHPGSMGTRAHQLAEYVIFDAPLTMLCDSPSDYEDNPECIAAISHVPTVWDETLVLAGNVGEYIVEARRSGERWWIAAMTDWAPRSLEIPIPEELKSLTFTAIADGANAHRDARDYKKIQITTDDTLRIELAPGGGFLAEQLIP